MYLYRHRELCHRYEINDDEKHILANTCQSQEALVSLFLSLFSELSRSLARSLALALCSTTEWLTVK